MNAAAADPILALEVDRSAKDALWSAANAAHDDAQGVLFKTAIEARSPDDEARVAALEETSNAACDLARIAEEKMAATPATSAEGVAVKLRRACYWISLGNRGPEEALAESALADLDRLCGAGRLS